MSDGYKKAAQQKKANFLYAILKRYRFESDRVKLMDNKDWSVVAHVAGVHVPSEETRQLVIEYLKRDEARERIEGDREARIYDESNREKGVIPDAIQS